MQCIARCNWPQISAVVICRVYTWKCSRIAAASRLIRGLDSRCDPEYQNAMSEILQLLIDRIETPIGEMSIVAAARETSVLWIGQTTRHACVALCAFITAKMDLSLKRLAIRMA
jgi:hypothetical protein